jgi:hypothetical protein
LPDVASSGLFFHYCYSM